MAYLLVGIGGILGSLTRYTLGKLISKKSKSKFPLGTFIINITGALLLGIISGLNIKESLYLLLADGFLGAYTTFSTFMYEGLTLFKEHELLNFCLYISISIITGILGFTAGFMLARVL